jgi:hypothetical protein
MPAIKAAIVATAFLLVSERSGDLHAYLDPGTGSVALQMILGALLAAFVSLKMYWGRLRAVLQRSRAKRASTSVKTGS